MIIADSSYMSLATTDGQHPWVAPVELVVDDQLTFYLVSLETSRHDASRCGAWT